MTTTLLGLPYSPWSEKARWALDVRRVPYRYRVYQPLIGEPGLRFTTKRFTGVVTVPVLIAEDGAVLDDSAKIARWADGRGEGPRLFPAEHEAAIDDWIARSERGLEAGRVISLHRTLASDEALTELVPRGLRGVLGPLAPRLGGLGVRRTLRKYRGDAHSLAEHERTLRAELDALRAATKGRDTILDAFSFADIAAAQILAFVSPPSFGLKLGKASRKGFTDEAIANDYPDVIAWRDRLYEQHRPRA
jgi:glutathione S-transferase